MQSSHFIEYLDKLPPTTFEKSTGMINNVLEKGTLGYLSRLFNLFPVDQQDNPPLPAKALKILLARLNEFYKATPPAAFALDRKQYVLNEVQSNIFYNIINKMICVACEELLQESGELREEIVEKLGLQRILDHNRFGKKLVISQIIYSFFAEIVSASMHQVWTMDVRSVVPVSVQRIGLGIINGLKRDKVIEKKVRALRPADQPKTPTKNFSNLLLDVVPMKNLGMSPEEKWLADFYKEHWPTVVSEVKKLDGNPLAVGDRIVYLISSFYWDSELAKHWDLELGDEFIKSISEVVHEYAQIEHRESRKYPPVIFNLQLQQHFAENKHNLIFDKMSDYTIYGKPLTDNFHHSITVDLTRNNLNGSLLNYLTAFFNNLIVTPSAKYTEMYVTKLAFMTFAKLLTQNGKLKAEYLLHYMTRSSDSEASVTRELCSTYISLRFNKVFHHWMSIPDNQVKYFQELPADCLKNALKGIRTLAANGLSVEMLGKIRNFPFIASPRTEADCFAVPLIYKEDEPTKTLRKKLFAIKQMIDGLITQCDEEDTDLEALSQFYEDSASAIQNVKLKSHALENQLQSLLDQILEMKLQVQESYTCLKKLGNDLANNLLTQNFAADVYTRVIDNHLEKIATSLEKAGKMKQTIETLLKPQAAVEDKARELQAEIFSQLKIISQNSGFWEKRVHGAGSEASAKISQMRLFLQTAGDQATLASLIKAYAENQQVSVHGNGMFKQFRSPLRDSATADFCGSMDTLLQLSQQLENFNNQDKLTAIKTALNTFIHKHNLKPAPSEASERHRHTHVVH